MTTVSIQPSGTIATAFSALKRAQEAVAVRTNTVNDELSTHLPDGYPGLGDNIDFVAGKGKKAKTLSGQIMGFSYDLTEDAIILEGYEVFVDGQGFGAVSFDAVVMEQEPEAEEPTHEEE